MAMTTSSESSLDALPAVPVSIDIGGETVDLTPLKVGELPAFVRAIRPFAQHITSDVDWLALFGERGDDAVIALSVAVRRPREWVADLPLDAAIRMAEAVFEVNADFFIRQVTPALLRLAGRIGQIGESFSSGSLPTGTTTPTS